MNREEKERQERLQRMLARDRGETPPAPPSAESFGEENGQTNAIRFPGGTAAGTAGQGTPPENRPDPALAPEQPITKESLAARRAQRRRHPNSPILRRRIRRRRLMVLAVILALALLAAWAMGAVSAAMTMASDLADSIALSFEPGGWPASTGIADPIRIEELAGGFVELGATDAAVFGANGAKVRTIQPGYARPAIAVGNTRFALYNRAGAELRVENRTRTLYTKTFENNILLCAMSANGTTAVVTETSRYAARVTVLDPLGRQQYQWYATQSDGTPVALCFADDNRRFAAGCVSVANGQVCTKVFLMDLDTDAPTAVYTADAGSMVLHLYWQGGSRVLAVLSDYAALLDAADGRELARYDYGGASLLDVDRAGDSTALLLSGQGNATLTVLGGGLTELVRVDAGAAKQVCATDTALYLSGGTWVRCVGYDGAARWETELASPPLAVLDAGELLVFTGTDVSILTH